MLMEYCASQMTHWSYPQIQTKGGYICWPHVRNFSVRNQSGKLKHSSPDMCHNRCVTIIYSCQLFPAFSSRACWEMIHPSINGLTFWSFYPWEQMLMLQTHPFVPRGPLTASLHALAYAIYHSRYSNYDFIRNKITICCSAECKVILNEYGEVCVGEIYLKHPPLSQKKCLGNRFRFNVFYI